MRYIAIHHLEVCTIIPAKQRMFISTYQSRTVPS